MPDEEVTAQLGFLENKINKVTSALSALHGSLATGSVWQRINGQILVPESVTTGVIAPLAITETKIDSNSISTPKLQANSITANKLEAILTLSTEIVAGSIDTGPDPDQYHGVQLSSAGLKLFNDTGVQRGWLKTDGSGWLGSSTGLSWTSAGVLTATGITVATGTSGARLYLDTTGIVVKNASDATIIDLTYTNGLRLYNGTGTQRAQLNMDGSGWYGSSTALSWDASGVMTATGITTQSGSTTAKAILDSNGLRFYNSSGVNTSTITSTGSGRLGSTDGTDGTAAIYWDTTGASVINATKITTGTLTGRTVQTATSGARVMMDTSGLYVYDSGGNIRAQFLATGAGYVGYTGSSTAVSWTSAGASTINATDISTGSLNGALLSAGSVGDSSVAALSANKITAGTGVINDLEIKSSLTLSGTSAKIVDSDGSEWNKDGIILKNTGTGAEGDTIKWQNGGVDKGTIYAQSNSFFYSAMGSSATAYITAVGTNSAVAMLAADSVSFTTNYNSTQKYSKFDNAGALLLAGYLYPSNQAVRYFGDNGTQLTASAGLKVTGDVYPGNQTTRGLSDNGTALKISGPYLHLVGSNSSNNPIFKFDSVYSSGSTNNWSTAGPGTAGIATTSTTYVLVDINGTLYRMAIWANG